MSMRFAVVDDEPCILSQISDLLKNLMSNTNVIVDCYQNSVSFSERYRLVKYDAYFLDIDMPIIDGFELSQKIIDNNIQTPIIYVTGRDELIIHAFRYHALGFVRKHNLESELKFALTTLLQEINKSSAVIRVSELRKNGGKEHCIAIEQISYIESENHNTHIHHMNGTIVTVRKTLSYYTELSGFESFILINSGILVNLKHIKICSDKVVLDDGTVLYISRRKLQAVSEAYLQSQRRLLI